MQVTDEQIAAIDEALVKMEEHVITVLGEDFFNQWLGTQMIALGIQMVDDGASPQDLIGSGLDILDPYLN